VEWGFRGFLNLHESSVYLRVEKKNLLSVCMGGVGVEGVFSTCMRALGRSYPGRSSFFLHTDLKQESSKKTRNETSEIFFF